MFLFGENGAMSNINMMGCLPDACYQPAEFARLAQNVQRPKALTRDLGPNQIAWCRENLSGFAHGADIAEKNAAELAKMKDAAV